MGDVGGKPQWKAAIDFKWIRDNKEAVAANIKDRNSNANLELVLELYENMFNLQKVRFLFKLHTWIIFYSKFGVFSILKLKCNVLLLSLMLLLNPKRLLFRSYF